MNWMKAASALALLGGCQVDYELGNKDGERGGDGDSGVPDSGEPALACELDIPDAGSVSVIKECEAFDVEKVADAWDLRVEWQFTAGTTTVVSPVVGQLSDDNGDGVIDENDTPDIAFTNYSGGNLQIVNGDGTPRCTAPGFRYDGGVIIADIDGDGINEVAGPTSDNRVAAVDGDCNREWFSADAFNMLYPVSTAADLDGDGKPEVIVDTAIVDGATGNTVASITPSTSCWRTPIAADLDLDGRQEVILGETVYNHRGVPQWSAPLSGTSCFGAVVNVDDDDEAEVVMSIGTTLALYEHDGTQIRSVTQTASNPGPPCAGDIDGDGEVEIIAPSGSRIYAYEHDLRPKWDASMQDSSGAAGCSVFDMNGDGVYEVLFADEIALRVYDGATGTVQYENTTHGSVTYFEYPTIADVDNDGSAEMIVANSSGSYGAITVFGHAGSGWPAAGPTWGLHDFAMTNQGVDGSLPAAPEPSWLEYNLFRGRPFSDGAGRANLEIAVPDVCVTSCEADGEVLIAYQVSNSGGEPTKASATVSLYMLDGGTETFYTSATVSAAASGEALSGGAFTVPLADMGADGFVLRTDDDNGVSVIEECLEDDNAAYYREAFCE